MVSFKRRQPSPTDFRGTASTDAGGIVLWSRAAFASVTPDAWDEELCENDDIKRHIDASDLVPIFIGFDGVFRVEVRLESTLTDRERRHVEIEGRGQYRLVVSDAGAWVSGLEEVGAAPASGFGVALPAGEWSAGLAMIAWDTEPGSKRNDGGPSASALSDFVVLLRPARSDQRFATDIEPFERPG